MLQPRKDERKYNNKIRIFIFFNINNSFGVKYMQQMLDIYKNYCTLQYVA